MTTIILVSCVARKQDRPAPAADLYISPWFGKARRYAETSGARWFILSAKCGLLAPDQVIEPYDQTLLKMPRPDRLRWASRVLGDLRRQTKPHRDEIVLLAGARYREYLVPMLLWSGYRVAQPLSHLGIGQQLAWFDRAVAVGAHSVCEVGR